MRRVSVIGAVGTALAACALALPGIASAAKQPRAAVVDTLEADPTSIVAGENTQATVRIHNDGKRPLPSRKLLMRLNGDGSGVLATETIPRLQPNRSVRLKIDVPIPAGAQPGAQNLRACRAQKDDASKCSKARLDTPITVIAPADLQLSPANHDFGTHATATSATAKSFTLTNVGGAPSGVPAITLGGGAGEFSIAANTCTAALGPGEACSFEAGFSPTSVGTKDAAVAAAALPGGAEGATLTGTGANPANLTIAPTDKDFGSHATGTTSPAQTFTVTNTGGVPSGTISTLLKDAEPDQFSKSADNCNGQTLAAGASCTVNAAFVPTSAGPKNTVLQAAASPGGSALALLSGTGLIPATLEITPATHDFGQVVQGNVVSKAFQVKNIGELPTGNPVTIGGPFGSPTASQFSVTSSDCVGALNPNQTCTVNVQWAPPAAFAGPASGTLSVGATPGGSDTTDLSGTAITPANLTITPDSHDFGNVLRGTNSPFQAFTITNTGQQDATNVGFGLTATTGGSNLKFGGALTGCGFFPVTIPGGSSCSVHVNFSPLAADLGPYGATLSVSGNPGVSDSATVSGNAVTTAADLRMSITTTGVGQPADGTFTSSQSFPYGSAGIGTIATVQVWIKNFGEADALVPSSVPVTRTNADTLVFGSGTTCNVVTGAASKNVPLAFTNTRIVGGTTCVIQFQFQLPDSTTDPGPFDASFTIAGDPGNSISAMITGTAS